VTSSASDMLKVWTCALSDEERQSHHGEAAVLANIPQRDTNLQDVDVPGRNGRYCSAMSRASQSRLHWKVY
jgi:hypothetical protein